MRRRSDFYGYGGWGTDQAFVALKRSGLSYEPDIVISQFDTNDLIDNITLSGIGGQKPFRLEVVNGELTMRTVQPKPVSWLKKFLLESHVVFYTNNARWVLSELSVSSEKRTNARSKRQPTRTPQGRTLGIICRSEVIRVLRPHGCCTRS